MHRFLHRLGLLRQWWRGGLPLRVTMMVVVVAGVAVPAGLLLITEQKLTQRSQKELLAQGENALMSIGSVALAEPMWVVDHHALEVAAQRLLENPQVVAIRIEENLSNHATLERTRPGDTRSLDDDTQAGRLHRRVLPIARAGERLGTLTVWFDAAFGQSLLQQRRSEMLLLIAVQVLAILAVLAPVLVSRVIRPIERLKAQTTSLLDHRPDAPKPLFYWKRRDELGMLGRHLSQVQNELRDLFSEISSKNAQLEQMALYDQLTGLPNRSLFTELVQREMLQARRSQQRFGVFFVDLDRFKTVNDSLGHAAGDELLVAISRRLQEAVREVDVVCRQSGDEFLVLARNVEHWESLGEMAERVLAAVEEPVGVAGTSTRVSASIGIALFPDDADDFENLVKNADIAMYQAKALGRARYSFFHAELNTRLRANMVLEQQLGQAITGGELVLHYQPQVDAVTGALVGVEALVRWRHPQQGMLYPASFISIAEESGKIAEMGVWTLSQACRQKAAWVAAGLDTGVMAVNVSALEFRSSRLLDSVQKALEDSGISPTDLEIEITESVLMAETETGRLIIEKLRALGVGIAIDDFGTGYSSLSYLKRLKPNQLKIDRSFVNDSETDSDSRAIIRGVVGLADALGLSVVAEGVETTQQMHLLRDVGCQTLQGYLIARPMPVDALEVWMQRRESDNSLFS